MATQVNSQIGKNSEYVNAVVRLSDMLFAYERSDIENSQDMNYKKYLDPHGCGWNQFGMDVEWDSNLID